MKKIIYYLLFSGVSCTTYSQICISHVTLLDVQKHRSLPDQTVVIRNGLITHAGPSQKTAAPANAVMIDGTGKWLMPGMVDAHVHFFQSGGLYTRPDAIDLRASYPYEQEKEWCKTYMEDQLRRYLSAGITTVIDDGATFNLLRKRDSFRNRKDLPAILMAGPLISTNYMPKSFELLQGGDAPFFKVTTAQEAETAVQQQYTHSPDFIKIWYIIRSREDAANNLPMVKAVVEDAHKNHYKVAIHGTQKIAAEYAVSAGADHLVHSIDDEILDPTLISRLKKNGVVLCPTLTVMKGYVHTLGADYHPSKEDIALANPFALSTAMNAAYLIDTGTIRRQQEPLAKRRVSSRAKDSISKINLKLLCDAGVYIATGTDAGNIGTMHASSYYRELSAMRDAGLSNWQILEASTLGGARVLGKESIFGTIAPGKVADLVLLDANPLSDLENLKQIQLIINKGTMIKPDTMIRESPEMLAQRQLNAYNAYDLEAFLDVYTDDVKVYNFPAELVLAGKEAMRKRYAFLNSSPGLHAAIKNRTVLGNMVVDHEIATTPGKDPREVIVIYIIKDQKISEVYFRR